MEPYLSILDIDYGVDGHLPVTTAVEAVEALSSGKPLKSLKATVREFPANSDIFKIYHHVLLLDVLVKHIRNIFIEN